MVKNTWERIGWFDHKFYQDEDGRIALADRSGQLPEETDDGTLWLDTEGIINEDGDIPLVDAEGRKCGTVCGLDQLVFVITSLSQDYGLQLKVQLPTGQLVLASSLTEGAVRDLYGCPAWA